MFKGKNVLITGGTSGLGKVLVDEFIKTGAKVCFTYKNNIRNAESIVKEYGADKILAIQADASLYDSAVKKIKKC